MALAAEVQFKLDISWSWMVAVRAWRLRQALDAGAFVPALTLAADAQHLHWTRGGESLRLLIAWLNAQSALRIQNSE